MFGVEFARGIEVSHGAGFQTQTLVAATFGFCDEMLKHLGGDALFLEGIGHAHGFDFGVVGIEFFQSAATGEVGAVPDGPEGDTGLAQAIEVKRVAALRRGNFRHAAKVLVQERDDGGAGEVVRADLHLSWYVSLRWV